MPLVVSACNTASDNGKFVKLPHFDMKAADADNSGTVDENDIEEIKKMIMTMP